METINNLVEELAAKLIETDSHNLHDLANLQNHFQRVSEEASKVMLKGVAAGASAAVELTKKIILEEVPNREAALDLLSQTVTSLQAIVRDGRKEEEVTFPEALGLQKDKAATAQKVSSLPHVDEEILVEFLSQQDRVLQEMEANILLMEKEKNQAALAALRRLIHTLKGDAGVLGLAEVARLCHTTEDYIDAAEEGLAIDKLLAVKDWLAQTFKSFEGKEYPPEQIDQFIAQLTATAPEVKNEEKIEEEEALPSQLTAPSKITEGNKENSLRGDPELTAEFIAEAKEHLDTLDIQLLSLETDPGNEEVLNAIFRVFHTIKGTAGFLLLDNIAELAHKAENLLDKARKKELLLVGNAIDVIFDAVDALKQLIERVKDTFSSGGNIIVEGSFFRLLSSLEEIASGKTASHSLDTSLAPDKKLGEILIEKEATNPEKVETALKTQQEAKPPKPKLGELLVKEGVAAKEVAQAIRSQKGVTSAQGKVAVKEAMRVDADRLDLLVDTIGELVIISSMISQDKGIHNDASNRLSKNLAQMDKITRELQDLGLSLRMVTIKPTFQKMARMVRDLAKKTGKKVDFSMSGEDTELDKSIVDCISDPLIHLVRNAVDHGIEDSPEDRRKAGKSEVGQIAIQAFHKGGKVYIQLKDDGKGLNKSAILVKAKERGLVKEGESLSDQEVYNLIFAPGFSTAKKVTNISGRGVGMDVVKKNIEALRGQVEIESVPGKGSTFSFRLPLTLAIIDGMVVKVGEEDYIIPTISIVESLKPRKEEITTVFKRGEMVKVRGQLIPLFRISNLFNISGARDDPTEALVVVVEDEGKQTGLLVNNLIGQQSTVIKSLGEDLQGIAGISGGTIMADGRVGIILDISGIVKLATNNSK